MKRRLFQAVVIGIIMLLALSAPVLAISITMPRNYPASVNMGIPPPQEGGILWGELIGTASWGDNPAVTHEMAFDGNINTFYDPAGVGVDYWTGMRMNEEYILTEIRVHPRYNYLDRFEGATIQGSNDGENWTDIWSSGAPASTPAFQIIRESDMRNNDGWIYFRYTNPIIHGDVAEVEFWGKPLSAPAAVAPAVTAAPVSIVTAAAPVFDTAAGMTADFAFIAVIAVIGAAFITAVLIKRKRGVTELGTGTIMQIVKSRSFLILPIIMVLTAVIVIGAVDIAGDNGNGSRSGAGQIVDKTALRVALADTHALDIIPDNEIGQSYLYILGFAREVSAAARISQAEIDRAAENLKAASYALLHYLVQPDAQKTRHSGLLSELFIYGVRCAYDEQSRTFYFPSSANLGGYVHVGDFSYTSGLADAGPIMLRWESVVPEFGRAYTITAISREYTYRYTLIFTGMPIVQITGITEATMSRSTARPARFALTYHDGDRDDIRHIESGMLIRHRGASSMGYPKKSYAFWLVDRHGRNNNIPLLGMRRDNTWILDAMYIDRSKMRERVSMDIWNSYDVPLLHDGISAYPVIANGVNGRFVEVFIENEYWGLYCLTETVNRKQLGLKRYNSEAGVQSIIYKGQHWAPQILFRRYTPEPHASAYFWGGWRQDFPDPRRGYPVHWDPLFEFVRFTVDSSDEEFAARAADFIHVENFVDYLIFQMITYVWDNTGKNLHWSIYDINDPELNRIFVTPWDLDAIWGDTWHFGRTAPTANWMNITDEHDSLLWRRLINSNTGGFRDKLVARWTELRTAQLSLESILARFDVYFDLFEETRAWHREMQRWPRHGFPSALQSERDYIFDWIEQRWPFIDDFILNRLDELQNHPDMGERYWRRR